MKQCVLTVRAPVLVLAFTLQLPLAHAKPAAAQPAVDCTTGVNDLESFAACGQGVNDLRVTAIRIPEHKQKFVAALRQFMEALPGTYGDEGRALLSSIGSMQKALARWDGAIRAFETALGADHRSPDAHLALGTVYLDRHRVDEALREFAAAYQSDPRRADALTLQASAYSVAQKPAEALQAMSRASALDPDNPSLWYGLAQRLLKAGRPEEAETALHRFREAGQTTLAPPRRPRPGVLVRRVDLLQQSTGVAPIFPPALYVPGFRLLADGKYAQAIARFREAVALDPLSAWSTGKADRTLQGSAALRQGKLRSALDHLEAAVQLTPDRVEAHRILGVAYRADEQMAQSIEQFTAAVRLNPQDERSRMALVEVLVSAGRPEAAEQALLECIRTIPDSGQAYHRLARLYQSRLRHRDALDAFQEAVKHNPLAGVDQLYHAIAGLQLRQTNFDGAIEAYAKRIDVNPNDDTVHNGLGALYLQLGRYDDALAESVAALLINPRNADAYAAIGQVHLANGRYADAAAASRRALELDRSRTSARYALGTSLMHLGKAAEGEIELQEFQRAQAEALAAEHRELALQNITQDAAMSFDNGDYERTIALLRQVIPADPTEPSSYRRLGVALAKAGRHDEAIEQFKKALALNAGPDIYRHLAQAYKSSGRLAESQRQEALYERTKEERLRKMSGGAGR